MNARKTIDMILRTSRLSAIAVSLTLGVAGCSKSPEPSASREEENELRYARLILPAEPPRSARGEPAAAHADETDKKDNQPVRSIVDADHDAPAMPPEPEETMRSPPRGNVGGAGGAPEAQGIGVGSGRGAGGGRAVMGFLGALRAGSGVESKGGSLNDVFQAAAPPPAKMRPGIPLDGSGGERSSGQFEGRPARINDFTRVAEDAESTFAVDVDTAAYSIARRSLGASELPNPSLVRVEEFINYFQYDYDPPTRPEQPFSIQADGGRSPVDGKKYLLRVGIQAQRVTEAGRRPTNLVFLVDTSGSMMSPDKLPLAKQALAIAVDHLTAKDQVAITTYAGGVRLVLPPTPAAERSRIKAAIESLESGGGTAMASGLLLAYKQASAMLRDGTNTRIIVCSDGDANIGATEPRAMLEQLEGYVKEGVTLSTIGFGDGNYKDATMEEIADHGNGNYFYVDSLRQAERVFGRDLTRMVQDVAQDVKIQVVFDQAAVEAYRLVGYENRDIRDQDFRDDAVDAGEIGAGHQVTALYELMLKPAMVASAGGQAKLAEVRVRAKAPRALHAKEVAFQVPAAVVVRPFTEAPDDFRFAVAVMGAGELMRQSPHATGWTYGRVLAITSDLRSTDPDRVEFRQLVARASALTGDKGSVSRR